MAKKFIQAAIKKPGRLTAAAKRAGMSVGAYAAKAAKKPGGIGPAARLYENVLRPAVHRARTVGGHVGRPRKAK